MVEFRTDVANIYHSIDNALLSINDPTIFVKGNNYLNDSFNFYNLIEHYYKFISTKLINSNIKSAISIEAGIPSIVNGNIDALYYILTTAFMSALHNTAIGKIAITFRKENDLINIRVVDTGNGNSKEINNNKYVLLDSYLKLFNGYYNVEEARELGTTLNMYLSINGQGNDFIEPVILSECDLALKDDYQNKKILLFENNSNNNTSLSKIFETFNLEIDYSSDIESTLSKLKLETDYDLIFIDMLTNDNIEAAKTIKHLSKNFGYNISPIVALIPYKSIVNERKCFESGYDYCIPLAIDIDKLDSLITNDKTSV